MQLAAPTFSEMCVDAGISQRADHGVGVSARILNLSTQTNIRHVDSVPSCADTHQ
jgi:hypothetical protein